MANEKPPTEQAELPAFLQREKSPEGGPTITGDKPAKPTVPAEPPRDTGGVLGVSGAEIERQTTEIRGRATTDEEAQQDLPAFLRREKTESTGELGGVAARTFISGALPVSGVLPAAMLGAAAGAPVLPPFGSAVGGLVGAGVGLAAGMFAESGAREMGISQRPETLPPHLRPLGTGFEALGGGVAAGAGVIGVGRTAMRLPASKVGNMLNGILETAGRQPVRFGSIEAFPLVSGAIAEGIAEAVAPGDVLTRVSAGVTAGFLNPVRVITSAVDKSARVLRSTVLKLSPGARQTRAGELYSDFMASVPEGATPEQVLATLARLDDEVFAGIEGARPTAAMITGDARVAQLEAELARTNEPFFQESAQRADETIKAINRAILMFRSMGTTEGIQAAAELRSHRYRMALDRLMIQAQSRAVAAVEKAGGPNLATDTRASLSLQVREIYEQSIGRARAVERELWEVVFSQPNDSLLPKNAIKTYRQLQGEVPETFELPREIADWVRAKQFHQDVLRRVAAGEAKMPDGSKITKRAINAAEKNLSAREMIRSRGKFLELARGQSRSTDPGAESTQRAFGMMAEAILSDLIRAGAATKTTEFGRRGVGGRFLPATRTLTEANIGAPGTAEISTATPYDVARTYSFNLAETFDRSFAGLLGRQGPFGLRLPPEAILKKAFASGDEIGALQLQELQNVAEALPVREFASPEVLEGITMDSARMFDLQSRLLRVLVNNISGDVPSETGRGTVRLLSLSKAKEFLKKSSDIFDRFSEVKRDLEEAVSSQDKFDDWAARITGRRRVLESESAAAKILKVESVSDAITGAMGSPTPIKQLTRFVNLAKSSANPEEAIEGLRRGFWDSLKSQARGDDNRFQLGSLIDLLEQPLRPGLPTVQQFMADSGLMPAEQVARLEQLIDAAIRVNTAVSARAVGEQAVDAPTILLDLLVRASGSMLGTGALRRIQGGGQVATGPSLLVAARASQFARDLVQRIPNIKTSELLINALRGDPISPGGARWSLLAAITKTGQTPAQRMQDAMQLHAYAWQAGLLGIEDGISEAEPPGPDADAVGLPSFMQREQ